MSFDSFLIVDWSARSSLSPAKPTKDAIFAGLCKQGELQPAAYFRGRAEAMRWISDVITDHLSKGQHLFIGFDFAFGYPAGFAQALTGQASALAVWEWLAEKIQDDDQNGNNRFDVASRINQGLPGIGPFWGCPPGSETPHLPQKGNARQEYGLPRFRMVEAMVPGAQEVWKLYTTGSVGSQSLLGLPHLHALRQQFGSALSVWPSETGWHVPETPIVVAEIYPSLLSETPDLSGDEILDAWQVTALAQAFHSLQGSGELSSLFSVPPSLSQPDRVAAEEGWIFGAGAQSALFKELRPLTPPPLQNDCFALPPGVHWTPVDEALAMLRARLTPVVGAEVVPVAEAVGRVLASDVLAHRDHPPGPNSAVDGYGFAGSHIGTGQQTLPLLSGRAAAGAPFAGAVPQGSALRILTGAALPAGVDTVILEEDVQQSGEMITFNGPLKPGANTRKAGEDMQAGQIIATAERSLTPADLGMLSSVGVSEVSIRTKLKVAILSTGDELVEPGDEARIDQIYDANRPMLNGLLAQWGYEVVDMGRAPDDPARLKETLNHAAAQADVIFTTGGASAGDEDHVSAVLGETGSLALWRIALKPGRPLALGMWDNTPVFGFPGNPVAVLVCALIFARPSLSVLAGGGWSIPQGFMVPAGFSKNKKPGRREYLRARMTPEGQVETFKSEGSGRISGLSWAEGLVEIGDGAQEIKQGDLVRYIPFSSFGLT